MEHGNPVTPRGMTQAFPFPLYFPFVPFFSSLPIAFSHPNPISLRFPPFIRVWGTTLKHCKNFMRAMVNNAAIVGSECIYWSGTEVEERSGQSRIKQIRHQLKMDRRTNASSRRSLACSVVYTLHTRRSSVQPVAPTIVSRIHYVTL